MLNIHMTVTSFWYFLLLAIGFCIYYMLPRFQWVLILIMSGVFYYFAATPYTFLYLIFSTAVAYMVTYFIEKSQSQGKSRKGKLFLWCGIALNIIPWLLTSGSDLWISGSAIMHSAVNAIPSLQALPLAAAMGMAYYTSQVISYMIDCAWGTIERQKNPLKLLTFVAFFPQLTTGPISHYDNLKCIYARHIFSYKNMCFGTQRILWGVFKKLVIADRAGIIVNAIWGNLSIFSGYWHWVALLLYPILIYADFSGCMDIVLGTAELFDIHLEENFKNPFFSRTIREFWSRWHITLGKWAKDYVMYPILKTSFMVKLTKKAKKRFGKHFGKLLPAAFASAMVWLVMGIWHGGFRHIIGVSLFYWTLIELGELTDPFWEKLLAKLQINTKNFSWKFFQAARTYLIYSFGAVFFQAPGVTSAISFIKSLFAMFVQKQTNPWIFFDESILKTGVTYGDINLLIIGVVLLLLVAILREKFGYARTWIAEQGFVFRWAIWLGLFALVLIFGAYGPGYTASEFIYQGF